MEAQNTVCSPHTTNNAPSSCAVLDSDNGHLQLTTLPSELLVLICQFLPPSDLFTLFHVSRYVKAIAVTPAIWQNLTQSQVYSDAEDYVRRYSFLNAPVKLRCKFSQREITDGDTSEHAVLERGSAYQPSPRPAQTLMEPSSAKSDPRWRVQPREDYSLFAIDGLPQNADLVIGTADNGTVQLFNVRSATATSVAQNRNKYLERASVSCVKVHGNRVWISGDNVLQEWDATTFRPISQTTLDRSVTALAVDPQTDAPTSVYAASHTGLHWIDSRIPSLSSSTPMVSVPGYPLALLSSSFSSTTISLSGRFPSILTFDKRNLATILSSTYSGAHSLCSLLSLPEGRGVVAAGEYNGRGTIEMYASSNEQQGRKTWINRYTAARSSLLCLSQPAWSGELVMAGSADGAIRCFDTAMDGACVRELYDNSGKTSITSSGDGDNFDRPSSLPRTEVDEPMMITQILTHSGSSISSVAASILVDGKLRVLEVGSTARYDDTVESTPALSHELTQDEIERQRVDEQMRQAVRHELFGMNSLNALLVSFY
ncbi:uncharacterized protein V1518DRAFT_422322 [Limtongia smithiae]|uniref:uncharacterized protein n=1 Tax=Limtongia smithiae TaxID=1125753 RepID=UPI0034CE8D3B